MKKIAIIGSSGAGKSTLADRLGSILDIQVFHLDRFFWLPGWEEKPRAVRMKILEKLVRKEQWIIEGTYLSSSEPRLNAADTIIFLDIPPLLCLQRVKRRHDEYRGRSRPDLPDGCADNFNFKCVLKVFAFPLRGRRTLMKKLPNYASKKVIWLHSEEEVNRFLSDQQQAMEVVEKHHHFNLCCSEIERSSNCTINSLNPLITRCSQIWSETESISNSGSQVSAN